MSRIGFRTALALLLMGLPPVAGRALAQDEKKEEPAAEKKDEGPPERGDRGKIKPYDDVITKEAKSDPGLFLVHRLGDKVFYEIPTAALGKDLLWVTQLAATQSGHGYAGSPIGDRVVRWEQRGDDVLLRDVKYSIRADAKDPIRNAVEATSLPEIIEVSPGKAYRQAKAPRL